MSSGSSFRSRTLSYFRNTLPPAIHRLEVLSILTAFIAFFISISHLGKWSHCFTIIAFPITFAYWAIFAMRSSNRCASRPSDEERMRTRERQATLDSQTVIFRQSSPTLREGTNNNTATAVYPSYTTHLLHLTTTFLLAGMWSGGSWVAIATGAQYKKDGDGVALFIMPMFEGIFGYIDALILWAIFGLCLRARIRRSGTPVLE
ncbi:hypothetical protein M408DRAFT_186284 [Serendipita vermifera MAFF 305830]|uniref:Uncharacterized protein n=1 Tax=Serendipita vermifera MAFF 305830 TaxID=933852 RepID=A0A0C3BL23_SERVB|nr:hypothetical protein M408DRAFT_186284 [Serendipita vermifera MAFF 305830]